MSVCPVGSSVPLQAKKGRTKKQKRPTLSLELFLNGKNNSFASAIVVWEACNLLAQRQSLPWQADEDGILFYERQVKQGRGLLRFWLGDSDDREGEIQPLKQQQAEAAIAKLDIRAACLHLIYAACATDCDRPWEDGFTISDRQIEHYLGLDKRKDLSKLEKLSLINDLSLQACSIMASIHWPRQGRVPEFAMEQEPIWHMIAIHQHFETDELGCKHLVGLTFRVKAGSWAKHFLNQKDHFSHTAFYQYGCLPSCLLPEVTSNWQKHEGAIRMILWLLFKTRMGYNQPVTVTTLMRVAYGEDRVAKAFTQPPQQKRLLKTFEGDMESMYYYGIKPVFDPETYPPEIQPLWAKLMDLPDSAEEALNFWTHDGSQAQRLTDAAPRGKWKQVLNGRFLRFELPDTWESKESNRSSGKRTKRSKQKRHQTQHASIILSKTQIVGARKKQKLSQRLLAEKIGKSQSWVRDIENGRIKPNPQDQEMICKVLQINKQECYSSEVS
ncbi:MAG: multiprotein-bridging factor 1 family protein [Leptolyngbyaceae cyanobacterium]